MILVCVTGRHLSTTLGEHHVQNFITLKLNEKKIFKQNIHDYFDSYPNLHGNLDHIALTIYDIKNQTKIAIFLLITQRMSVGHNIV